MRKVLFGIACALVGACSSSMLPTAPSGAEAQTVQAPIQSAPLHHNISAVLETDETRPIVWVCSTQPRWYVSQTGHGAQERDHYVQRERCPEVPIP